MRTLRGGLRFGVLGPVTAAHGGRELDLGGPKQRGVLAMLLLADEDVLPVDRLVDGIWGEDPPARAVGALQVYVSNLRGALASDDAGTVLIEWSRPGYRLRRGRAELDLARHDALVGQGRLAEDAAPGNGIPRYREAMEVWRGEPLADVSHLPGPARMAIRLREMRAAVTEEYFALRTFHDPVGDLVAELQDAVAADPFRERRWVLLVRALWQAGRRCDALRACADLRTLLDAEFRIEPCTEITTLEHQIRAGVVGAAG